MNILPILLLALSLLLAVSGSLLLLRRPGVLPQSGALALLLLATAFGYTGAHLLWDAHHSSAMSVTDQAMPSFGTGRFTTIPAATLATTLAASRGHPVMLEFHADWCSSCIRWQQEVFSRADVQQVLQPLILIQIDASQMTPETQAVLDQYRLPGLPAMLFFDRAGKERPDLRLLGEMSAEEFKAWFATHITPLL
ncbi:MAG: thioredoxin family protein [Moraxellaceae bacterium]|nr:thioredoxin family protein [Moraxellaceae bacterium]MBP8853245.1 thioredoxin family protein [Moraxellaceae bacterium]MBP9731073.1 thioredoxin family protein [Moraxellaceae bacterium]MCC6199321.1 thioredoxin family protein [Moraxellaceae bacterium]